MNRTTLRLAALAACLLLALPVCADHRGTPHGKPGGDGSEDSDGHLPAIITLRDCQDGIPSAAFAALFPATPLEYLCPVTDDRIQSDFEELYEGGLEGVDAYIGSKGTAGNIWLKTGQSTRGLLLDLSDCAGAAGTCDPPFLIDVISHAAIYLQASETRRNGVFAMAVGESMPAPMRVYYDFDNNDGPGFIEFNPNLNGKSPCKGNSHLVTVTRTGEAAWEVYGEAGTIACVTLPGSGEFAGTYFMPFRFAVELK